MSSRFEKICVSFSFCDWFGLLSCGLGDHKVVNLNGASVWDWKDTGWSFVMEGKIYFVLENRVILIVVELLYYYY
jgi:Zn-finger protein